MFNFDNPTNSNPPRQATRPSNGTPAPAGSNVATARYAYFHIHQVKAWPIWAVDETEISYTLDAPRALNAERAADV